MTHKNKGCPKEDPPTGIWNRTMPLWVWVLRDSGPRCAEEHAAHAGLAIGRRALRLRLVRFCFWRSGDVSWGKQQEIDMGMVQD